MTQSFKLDDAIFVNLILGHDSLEQFICKRLTLTPELRPVEWYVLRILFIENGLHTLTSLSELFGKKANSFEHVVNKLKKHGYVITQKHPLDHRKSLLKLTDKANHIRDDFLSQAQSIDDEIQKHLATHFDPLLEKLRLLRQLFT